MAVWEEKIIGINGYARSGKKMTQVRKIIMHYTANNGAGAMAHYNYFKNLQGRYASAHFMIDKLMALLIIPLNEIAYHANDVQKRDSNGNALRGVKELLPNANYLSLGIEMCLEKDGTIHPDTIKRSEDVAVELCKRFQLDPLTDIIRHYDHTFKNCPAPWVKDASRFVEFKNNVKAKLTPTPVQVEKVVEAPKTEVKSEVIDNVLTKGDSNKTLVKEAQALLIKHGAKLVVDGDFGKNTEDAVKAFQSKNKLVADGVIGKNTWIALKKEPVKPKPVAPKPVNRPTIKEGDQGQQVKDLQFFLAKKGYNLAVDGDFGAKTTSAVKDFQKKNKLTADGIVGAKTWAKLV